MNHLNEINRISWDAYQADYMKFHLLAHPDYYTFYANGGVRLDSYLVALLGDVRGLSLLDTCCACDAVQAFSWHNLGAKVTACDIAPTAIQIAEDNAKRMGLEVNFVVTDMQTLDPISDGRFDIVFATYPVWIEDIKQACQNWHRVLKQGGRLLLSLEHPITYCITQNDLGMVVRRNYNTAKREVFERFEGTPAADRFGGWSADVPSVENFYRISDLVNAVISAGFTVMHLHESEDQNDASEMGKLPCDFAILAKK